MNSRIHIFLWLLWPAMLFGQNLANFTQVGPVKFPDNPSVQTTGMGRVSHLVYHPTDSSILFAVTASGGVFKSSNEGTSWKPTSDFIPQTSCASVAINPLKPDVMLLGTGDANYNGGGLGVWRTNNGGGSWFQSNTGMGNRLVSYILYTPGDTNTVIAACSDGIYKSTNGGGSWVKKTTVNASYRDLTYRPSSNTILYAASNANFYRSYDNGDTWIQSTINASITCAGVKVAVCPTDTSKIYCVVWKSGATSPFGGVYKSTNNGTTFTLQADTPNILGYSSNGTSLDGQGAYNLGIATDPQNSNTLYIGAINIWKSTDQGASFTMKSHWAYGVHADKHGFLFSPYNPNKIFIYHDGGLDRSMDGGTTWTTLEDGLSASEFYKMGNSGLYSGHILGGLQDNGMDVAVNKKFSTVRGGDWGGDFAFDAFDSSIVYENGGIKRNIANNATGNINGHNGIYTVHPNDSNVMFEATTNLYRTTNLRANPTTNVSWTQITSITGNTSPNGMAYAKSSYGTFYVSFTPQSLYRSVNVNATSPAFTKITTFPFNSGEQVKQLESSNIDSNIIYVLTSQSRLFRSSDKGSTWVNLNKNLPATTIIKFLLDQNVTDSSMYAATAFAVYYRNRFTGNWINFSQGLPTVAQISDMEIMSDGSSDSRLHISTYGRGIWQTDLYKTTAIAPTADFTVQPSSSQSCANTILLVDNSLGSPTSRKWEVSPATGWSYINGTDSFSSRAEIRFNTAGAYFITLTVSNSKGNDLKTVNYNYSSLPVGAGCTTTTTNLTGFGIGISRVEFNTIDNKSNIGTASNEDFTCSASTIIRAGATYTAWVTTGTLNNETVRIYYDYNNNGVFTDANELLGSIGSGMGRRSCTFTILTNPPLLNRFLRLRVVSDFGTVNASCGTLGYGQSEDYAVWIDKTRPVITINVPKPTVSNSFTATFATSEPVYGFDLADINVGNGSASNFIQVNPNTYSAKITPVDNGKVVVGVNANGLTDVAGNPNNAFSDSTDFFLGIKTFSFPGLSLVDSIVQTPAGGSITCYVPFGTVLDTLVASYMMSDSSTAYVGGIPQNPGLTKNNFNSVLTFVIRSSDNSLSRSYTVRVVVNKNKACLLLTYGFASLAVSGTITQTGSGGSVDITVPFGTNITGLVATFSVSDSAKAYIGVVPQRSGTTPNNFSAAIVYTIKAQDTGFTKTYTVNITFGKSKSCDLLTYAIQSPATTGVITPSGSTGGTVAVTVPYGTPLTNLVALFTLSDSAKAYVNNVVQVSATTSNSFVTVLNFKVVAQDTNYSKVYTVTVSVAMNTEADLLTYAIVTPPITGTITPASFGGFVNLSVPFGTSLNGLIAQFTLSDSATAYVNGVLQQTGITTNNFTDTVYLTIKAQDGVKTKMYKIKVNIIPNVQCDLVSFKFNAPVAIGTVTQIFNGGTVTVTVPFSTNLGALVAEFVISDSAKATVNAILQSSMVTANDFTTPVTYTVTAQNNTNVKTYVVTVTKSTGVELRITNDQLRVYPNPANGELTIDKGQWTMGEQFGIYNALRQEVVSGTLSGPKTNVDVSDLASGVYFVRVETDKGMVTARFVKE